MSESFANGYALLIGVTESQVARWALPDVGKDIAALSAVLKHPERCAYPDDNIKVITGPAATRQGITDGLEWLAERLAADRSGDATAVVYYTGHGWRDKAAQPPTYFLIPYDVRENAIPARSLRAEDFAAAIAELRPKRLLVLLDCCHAGGMEVKALAPGVGATAATAAGFVSAAIPPGLLLGTLPAGETALSAAEGSKGLEQLAQGTGRAVLSSSQGEQLSYLRRDRKMSIFTYHLIEALTGHAQPADGATEVLVSDVMSHVWRRVPASARAEADAEQEPDYRVSGNFAVALLLGGKGLSKGVAAPDPLLTPAGPAPAASVTQTMGGSGVQVAGDQTVQGDLVIGNKIGRQINTDGGAYIGGSVTTGGGKFVGRDDVTVVGDGNVVGDRSQATVTKQAHQGATVEAFTRLLAEIRTLLPQAGLDLEIAQSVDADVQVIEQQAAKPKPNATIIASKLEEVTKLLTAAGGLAIAGGKLLPLAQKAVEWAGQLFR